MLFFLFMIGSLMNSKLDMTREQDIHIYKVVRVYRHDYLT